MSQHQVTQTRPYMGPCYSNDQRGTAVPAHRAWQAPPVVPSLFAQEGVVATKEGAFSIYHSTPCPRWTSLIQSW